MADENLRLDAVELATELTVAWLANPNTRASSDEVAAFVGKMHEAVLSLSGEASLAPDDALAFTQTFEPATTARRSLASKDHIISMMDGKPYKTLRRHLSTHGLTPAEYRTRYGLKSDYPMVAPNYSDVRRSMAKKIGLGRKPRETEEASASGARTGAPQARKTKQQPQSE